MLNIYLTDLSAYNSGYLIGKWVTLPLSDEELHHVINEILCEGETAANDSNHEEYFITDYEWEDLCIFEVNEYSNPFELNSKLLLLEGLDQNLLKCVSFLLEYELAIDLEDAISKADDVILYEDQSLEDVAYDLINECYDTQSLPSIISNNIDYKGIAVDLEYDGTYFIVDNDVFQYIG